MSSYSPTDLEAYVRQRAPEVTRDILKAAKGARNEADLVAETEKVLERFGRNFDVTLNLQRERTLINGRADAVYNRFVIEYEPPNSLRPSNNHHQNKHAIGQVTQYMDELERLDRHRKERLAGVVLDGGHYIFVRHRDEHFRIDDPVPVNTQSTETFLRYLLSLATELALTPENLVRDFGENSNTARQVVPAIYHALRTTDDAKVKVLFSQWKRQFQEVSGYDSSSEQLSATDLARLYAVRDRNPDIEHLFFAIHTYYATFIKVLALQVAHYYLMPKVGTGLSAVANYDTDKLRDYLLEMERGGLFTQLGIRNFLEGDFFGWYLEIWDDALDAALRRLIGDLANYSLVTLDVDPEETRDLLKHLYQNLMPKKLRHALGEYYTPDWLAERLLNQLGYKGEPHKRLLDPACGSGTFLVLAIKRIRQYADEKMLPPAKVLEQVLGNIVGFDLNPLAVISARTNYLLALGDLLSHRKGEISIPVYLADSVLTPSQGDDLYTQHGYSFQTAVGRFTVPRSLVDAHYIDQLADLLEECVHSGTKTEQFKTRVLLIFPLKADEDEEEVNIAVALYEQLLDLEQQGINGIWARIIKNAFAPRFQGRFDYVAGNPPWVNWESLPRDYREDTAPLWLKHKLFSHKGYDAILGGAKDDISVLLTYVATDSYLKNDGRLGFVITQSVFKAAGGGQGFRRFKLADGTPINVVAVDDMVEIKPFEGAANRTAVFIFERGRKTKYPVPYNLWRKAFSGKRIPEESTLEEALAMCKVRQFVAQPVNEDDPCSSWISGKRRAIEAVRKVLGASDYVARAGVCTWHNGIYWVEVVSKRPDGLIVVSNLSEGARNSVENVQAAVEPDLLYPLLRGRDVSRWQAIPQAHIIVTHEKGMGLKAIREKDMSVRLPKTYAYLKRFEEPLTRRSGYRRYFKDTDPFYSLFNIGDYTFEPYKVVWREVANDIRAAVAEPPSKGAKLDVPDHTLVAVSVASHEEAHYICALLNSSCANFVVVGYVALHPSPHIMTKIKIPKYDSKNSVHRQLADLSQQAHAATAAGDTARVQETEVGIDQLAKQLWGLSDAELREIQESLAELG
jgi:SAM-dependent methyltransferase